MKLNKVVFPYFLWYICIISKEEKVVNVKSLYDVNINNIHQSRPYCLYSAFWYLLKGILKCTYQPSVKSI